MAPPSAVEGNQNGASREVLRPVVWRAGLSYKGTRRGTANMKVCILWHMHQPDYRLPGEGGRAAMPWVRLHAAKDYMDMARLAEEAPANVRMTFNLTPCLLEQLHDLAEGRHSDAFLDIARKEAKDLTESERLYALQHFFSLDAEQQLRPLPRY